MTHIVYTLNDYNRSRLPPRLLRRERAFLKASMAWAIKQGEADTVGEIVDSLAGCGLDDTDARMMNGRAFILEQQRADGGWGDEDDEYGRFHSVWTCIDGLRDYAWRTELEGIDALFAGHHRAVLHGAVEELLGAPPGVAQTMSRRKKWISPG